MSHSIKAIFEDECKDLVFDQRLAKKLSDYHNAFVNKTDDHIQFFGGNLLGVHVVRFKDTDRDRWFDEILETYENHLKERLLALPTVNRNYHVSSDTMNLSCIWLVHAIFNSKHLSDKEKHEAMVNVILVLQYKFLTSRLFRHFQYPCDRALAEATYAQLSLKYAIKVYGSWSALLRARAEEIISPNSIHFRTITKMDADADVVYMLNDVQGRIRAILKNMYNVLLKIREKGIRVTSTSSVIEYDGESILKDKTKSLSEYERYLNSIITDKDSFIKEELLVIIEKIMHTMPPKLFRETLVWMSINYRQSGANVIEEVINETLIHSFDYLMHNRNLIHNTADIPALLTRLRGVYMSSRSVDPALMSLREKTEKIVKMATGNKNDSIIASVRTGTLLYIILRVYTKNHYS
jgi:hypothetical protein